MGGLPWEVSQGRPPRGARPGEASQGRPPMGGLTGEASQGRPRRGGLPWEASHGTPSLSIFTDFRSCAWAGRVSGRNGAFAHSDSVGKVTLKCETIFGLSF